MALPATPEAGFADGHGDYARFDGPSGLAAAEDGTVFVADTNNHLVRTRTEFFFCRAIQIVYTRLSSCRRLKMRVTLRRGDIQS